jgi:hypothetical protein
MKLQKLLKGRSPEASTVRNSQDDASTDSSRKESTSNASEAEQGSRIHRPTQHDVLFGRGKPYQGHEGNQRLHKVVNLYKARYSQARRHEKTEIAEEIVQFIKTGGTKAGRFLKRVEGEECWVEVGDSIARDKVSHALRGKPRKDDVSSSKSQSVMDELGATKRSLGKSSQSPAKRRKLVDVTASQLELLAAQRHNSMVAPMSSSSSFFPSAAAAASGAIPLDLRAQLMASALAGQRRQEFSGSFGLQLAGMSGMIGQPGGAFSPHLLANQQFVNQFLQLNAADRNLGADPRLWW